MKQLFHFISILLSFYSFVYQVGTTPYLPAQPGKSLPSSSHRP